MQATKPGKSGQKKFPETEILARCVDFSGIIKADWLTFSKQRSGQTTAECGAGIDIDTLCMPGDLFRIEIPCGGMAMDDGPALQRPVIPVAHIKEGV